LTWQLLQFITFKLYHMKTLITFFVFIVFSIGLMAQNTIKISSDDDRKINTIFKKEKKDGFYGSVSAGYSLIDNKDGITFSSRGCWIMDHFFSLGIGGTAFVNDIEEIPFGNSLNSNNSLSLAGGYGGVFFEPILLPLKPVHLSFPILIGAGAAGSFKDYSYFSTYSVSSNGDIFWVVEPKAELELNVTRWFRFAFYAGYRYTSQLNIEGISPNALRGYSAGITAKFGRF
jgi:hypothetical protein